MVERGCHVVSVAFWLLAAERLPLRPWLQLWLSNRCQTACGSAIRASGLC
ncbi:hypothetical protein APV28_1535 [Comamonas testosteroni]|nr:hypothetical protein APV28_1535 [Comamonas testosteroni]